MKNQVNTREKKQERERINDVSANLKQNLREFQFSRVCARYLTI